VRICLVEIVAGSVKVISDIRRTVIPTLRGWEADALARGGSRVIGSLPLFRGVRQHNHTDMKNNPLHSRIASRGRARPNFWPRVPGAG
jgi:hypothetical protein